MSDKVMASSSRARAPNFTREDQELLLDVIKPYLHIIECKKTDNIKLSQKTEAWSKVSLAYNANTKNVARSVENLISCYRNMKSKMKKQHSEAKMNLRDPVEKEQLITAIQFNGEDWDMVAETVNKPVDACKAGFTELKKEFKKHEVQHKKQTMGTGGGPPPDDEENPLKKLKFILEPQVDGLYTMYDGDADLMKAFQETLPEDERQVPIDFSPMGDQFEKADIETENIVVQETPSTSWATPSRTSVRPIINRQEILKKKRDPVLISSSKTEKASKKSCNETYQALAEAKSELVKLQTELVSLEIEHKKKVQQLELEDIIKENKYREETRQKKLMLLDLEIKKMCEQ